MEGSSAKKKKKKVTNIIGQHCSIINKLGLPTFCVTTKVTSSTTQNGLRQHWLFVQQNTPFPKPTDLTPNSSKLSNKGKMLKFLKKKKSNNPVRCLATLFETLPALSCQLFTLPTNMTPHLIPSAAISSAPVISVRYSFCWTFQEKC